MSISKTFILAGDATFTIETPNDGHRTYRVEKVEANERWPESYFVKLLTGPCNQSDYEYLGKLDPFTSQVKTSPKSADFNGSFPLRLLNRVLARVWCDDHAAYEMHGFKTHHEGRCGRCNRPLTVPESIESGIGPECSRKMAKAAG